MSSFKLKKRTDYLNEQLNSIRSVAGIILTPLRELRVMPAPLLSRLKGVGGCGLKTTFFPFPLKPLGPSNTNLS